MSLSLHLNKAGGLSLGWKPAKGLPLKDAPLRVKLAGQNKFVIWGVVDSGEAAPVWSEKDLNLEFFAKKTRIHSMGKGSWLAVSELPRGRAELSLQVNEYGELEVGLAISTFGLRPLPVGLVEFSLGGIDLGKQGMYLGAHAYGGRTYSCGPVKNLQEPGVSFVHGTTGCGLPLLCLHEPRTDRGLRVEFMLPDRPMVWLRPGPRLCVEWTPDRLLYPGEAHTFGGKLRLRGFTGRPLGQLWAWRDEAAARYGLRSADKPAWIRRSRVIDFNVSPKEKKKGFTRLDDPRCRELLERWRDWGFNTVMVISHFKPGLNWLSPSDYDTTSELGGPKAEKKFLAWARELGFHVGPWYTTVGVDRNSAVAKEHPDWFTRRPDGSPFYAWDSRPDNNYVGYAPDGDPLSSGWRRWLQNQAEQLCKRGWDIIFVDGCIPRTANHARWAWPGEGRNSVENQVADISAHIATLGPDKALYTEDESLMAQATTQSTCGRYYAMTPHMQVAYWDPGMGGGPKSRIKAPGRILPEQARDYLLLRYGSLLPGTVTRDVLRGYFTEATRPWVVQSLFSGMSFSYYHGYTDNPQEIPQYEADAPTEREKAPAWRKRGIDEFMALVRLCKDEPKLMNESPFTIEGVTSEDDAAVVGMLHTAPKRCMLCVMNFRDRPVSTRLRLAEPVDVPAMFRAQAGKPHKRRWRVTERMRSMVDDRPSDGGAIGAGAALKVDLAPYGFRVFELK